MLQRLSEFQARCHRTEWELDLTITCRLEFDQREREARQRLNNYRGEIWSPSKHHVAHSAPPLWPSVDGHPWSNIGPAAWMMGRNGIRMRRRRRRGMWTQTPRPAGMTFDSGSDLLLSYSDERLCLPSDNCSLRGRERSINQNELRYCRTPPPMADSKHASPTSGQTGRHRLQRIWPVGMLSFCDDSHRLHLTSAI